MSIKDKDFWKAYNDRDLKVLETYTFTNTKICFDTFISAAIKCLLDNDIELLKHIDFPTLS